MQETNKLAQALSIVAAAMAAYGVLPDLLYSDSCVAQSLGAMFTLLLVVMAVKLLAILLEKRK